MHYNYSDQATSLFHTYQIHLFPNIHFIVAVDRRKKNELNFMYKLEYRFCASVHKQNF